MKPAFGLRWKFKLQIQKTSMNLVDFKDNASIIELRKADRIELEID